MNDSKPATRTSERGPWASGRTVREEEVGAAAEEEEEGEAAASLLRAAARCLASAPSRALSSAAFSPSTLERVALSEAAIVWNAGQERDAAGEGEPSLSEAAAALALAESSARAAAGSARPSARKSASVNCEGAVASTFSPDSSSIFSYERPPKAAE